MHFCIFSWCFSSTESSSSVRKWRIEAVRWSLLFQGLGDTQYDWYGLLNLHPLGLSSLWDQYFVGDESNVPLNRYLPLLWPINSITFPFLIISHEFRFYRLQVKFPSFDFYPNS